MFSDHGRAAAILDYLAHHSRPSPAAAARELHIGLEAWYKTVGMLEQFDLVATMRPSAAAKSVEYFVTPRGQQFRVGLSSLRSLLEEAPSNVAGQRHLKGREMGPEELQAHYCEMLAQAQGRADFRALADIQNMAGNSGCSEEAVLGWAMECLMRRKPHKAVEALDWIPRSRDRVPPSITGRLALYTRATAKMEIGDDAGAFSEALKVHALSARAQDHALQALAKTIQSIVKLRQGHLFDAEGAIKDAEDAARTANRPQIRAIVAVNRGLVNWIHTGDASMPVMAEAIRTATFEGMWPLVARARFQMAITSAAAHEASARDEHFAHAQRAIDALGKAWRIPMADSIRRIVGAEGEGGPSSWSTLADELLSRVRSHPLHLGRPPKGGRPRRNR